MWLVLLPTCFNRTFMELKYSDELNAYFQDTSFNRTFMELKYRPNLNAFDLSHVLIVPLWN